MRSASERGAVTAELAILMPAVVLMLAGVIAAGTASMAQLRCVDAARTGARLAARADTDAAVAGAARAAAPAGARIDVSGSARMVSVRVSAVVTLPLPGRPGIGVGAQSVARREGPT